MKIGFIGLGDMGLGMVVNLVKNGFEVTGYDIKKERLLKAMKYGIIRGKNLENVAQISEVIILCLPHPTISYKVLFGEHGLANIVTSGKTIIETSTLTPNMVEEIDYKLTKKGIHFLSAPMFGGATAATQGDIWFVIEGNRTTLTEFKQLFLAMGRKITYVGKPPQATLAKLARNLCRFANVATALEVLNFLKSYTKEIKPIYKLIVEDSKTNFDEVWEKAIRKYALEDRHYEASRISIKDLDLLLDLAQRKKVSMPIAVVTRNVHEMHKK